MSSRYAQGCTSVNFSLCVYRWDILTGSLELVEQIDGYTDIVYGSFDPKYFKRLYSTHFHISFVCVTQSLD